MNQENSKDEAPNYQAPLNPDAKKLTPLDYASPPQNTNTRLSIGRQIFWTFSFTVIFFCVLMPVALAVRPSNHALPAITFPPSLILSAVIARNMRR